MSESFPMPRRWLVTVIVSAIAVFGLKVYLAYTTGGAPDISVWTDFLKNIKQCGMCVYEKGGLMIFPGGQKVNPFNHPPFMIHFLKAVGFMAETTGLSFAFVFRLITSLFDLGSVVVIYQLLKRTETFTPATLLIFVFAPATLIVSGYHGNTDTLMIFFLLLSVLALTSRPTVWLAGIIFGLALSIKIIPVIFVPCIFFYLPTSRKRAEFFVVAGLIFAMASLPYIVQDPVLIAREVFGYRGFPGRWGWTRGLYYLTQGQGVYNTAVRIGTYLLFGLIAYRSYKMNRNLRGPSLPLQFGVVVFVFLSLTTGWGTNYMAWLDPFVVLLGFPLALLYYITSGAMMFYHYFIDGDETTWLIPVTWLVVLLIARVYLRRTFPKESDE